MPGDAGQPLVLVDPATASTLAQVLPLLLLTLAVEVRRVQLHRAMARFWMAGFFLVFGLLETLLVLSIDGAVYPFQGFDAIAALTIFGVLAILFRLSFADPPDPVG